MLFRSKTAKTGECVFPYIAFKFPSWANKTKDNYHLSSKEKYQLVLEKITFHFPNKVLVRSTGREWSPLDVRKKGYLTFDLFLTDPRLDQPKTLKPGEYRGLERPGFQLEVKETGDYKILVCAELLLKTKIGSAKIIIQKEPIIKITM